MTNEFKFKRVMLVDDTKIDRYITSHVLNKNHFAEQVIEFDMATKAITYIEQNHHDSEMMPELILLDIRMPEMDGFQFLDEVSTVFPSINENCCIIMLSSSLDKGDRSRAENSPMVMKLINKPLIAEKFEEIISLCTPCDSN